jgi:cytochrome bd-type quinol oxidase subunit 2
MSVADEKPFSPDDSRAFARKVLDGMNAPARASVVNRTHRIVRERAKTIATRRSKVRSLWIPMAVCSALLVIISSAVWSILDQYDVNANGLPDASNQFIVLLVWFLPVSMALLALVLFRRARKRADQEAA